MFRQALAITIAGSLLIATGVVELWLLHEIFVHPAAPLPQGEVKKVLLHYGLILLFPLVSQLCVCVLAVGRYGGEKQGIRWSMSLSVVGVLAGVLALRNFGHATPGFLLLGCIAQWGIILMGVKWLWARRKGKLLT